MHVLFLVWQLQLNFPVGKWSELDASPARWDLPLFLVSLLLPMPRTVWRTMSETMNVCADVALSPKGVDVLARAAAAVDRGYSGHQLQASPHLVLVQPSYYDTDLKPLVAQWAVLWLLAQPCVASDMGRGGDGSYPDGREALLLEYVTRPLRSVSAASKDTVRRVCSPSTVKLMNLARDWIATFLPHCLSKVNRVHYGLLQESDWRVRKPVPGARLFISRLFAHRRNDK